MREQKKNKNAKVYVQQCTQNVNRILKTKKRKNTKQNKKGKKNKWNKKEIPRQETCVIYRYILYAFFL